MRNLKPVNQWSLAPIQHQQETLIWGAAKKETLFSANSSTVIQQGRVAAEQINSVLYSSIMRQHGCGTALLRGGPGARQPLSA